MSKKTTDLIAETTEKYLAFQESLQETVSSIKTDMENIELMSQQAELYDQLEAEVDRLRVRAQNAVRKPEEVAQPFEEFQETVSLLRMVEANVSKLVLAQADRARAKTESAIEMALKITESA